ncbi:General transcription factor IIE subunit 1-like protein [Drosera capensis]
MSVESFNRLVKLMARAFYDDITTKGDNQPKITRSDNRGIAVIILDALTRRQWVREEDLAKDLRLHSKQLRRILRFFEEEKLVMRDHRRETAKGVKLHNAAVAATADGQRTKEGEEKIKLHTHSYCCLDYAQIYDVVRYRIHRMRKKLKDELEEKNTVQEYICPNCGKRYNALDAVRLISMEDDYFHCESCNGELIAESDKVAAQELGDGDDNARRRRREKLLDMLDKIDNQLQPLMDLVKRVQDLPPPDYGTLQAWEAQASAAARGLTGGSSDVSKTAQGLGGSQVPFFGETKVEVAFLGFQAEDQDSKPKVAEESKMNVPWLQPAQMAMARQGDVQQETKAETDRSQAGLSDDKKSSAVDEASNLQVEYLRAYYDALFQKQKEQELATKQPDFSEAYSSNSYSGTSSDRQVGLKAKREDDFDEDVKRQEAAPSETIPKNYKVDLNVVADPTADDDDDDNEDDVDWEEG